ncbi:MAG: leucyl aminopeptidase [Crocinitomicaceae bacterium]|nr:leucyl aminopeptidase [Crocinitomicaceae bacterium]
MIRAVLNTTHNTDENIVYLVENAEKFNNIVSEKKISFKSLSNKLKDKEDAHFVNDLSNQIFYGVLNEDLEKCRRLGSKAQKSFSGENLNISIKFDGNEEKVLAFLEGFLMSTYDFRKYFSEEKKSKIGQLTLISDLDAKKLEETQNTVEAALWTREMVNEPVSYLNAPKLAKEIEALFSNTSAKVEVFEKAKIESLKMGGLLAVNKGSIDPPTFTIIEYKPASPINSKPIVLVGKGVVYDTGGLSLKPTPNSMDLMKSDMGGAAMMCGTTAAVVKNNLPLHIITLIPATDNRPGGNAYAPGDVIKMYNGKTVEVLNTDAEGRMILADALSYGDKFEPMLVIDAATLTGAAIRAIGTYASCIMGNADEKYFDLLEESGKETFERTVKLPFWEEYGEEMKSKIADLKNIGGPYAGMISAGKFLEHFTTSPYIHIDIAGPSFTQSPKNYESYGGTGYGVRLLYNFLKKVANGKA